jgi:hypothetical protein
VNLIQLAGYLVTKRNLTSETSLQLVSLAKALSFSAKLKDKGNKKIYFFITQVGFANFVCKT